MNRESTTRTSRRTIAVVVVAVILLICSGLAVSALFFARGTDSSDSAGLALPDFAYQSDGGLQAPGALEEAARGSAVPQAAAADSDAVIVTAAQQVVVTDVAAAARRLSASVTAAGGSVTGENTSYGQPCAQPFGVDGGLYCESEPMSVITYRAPADSVDALMAAAASFGTESWRTRSEMDVSAEVADVDSRVASARASLDRLNALMARADSLTDIIALESQIATRQAELEALQARQRALADQTSMATVTTTFITPAATEAGQGGFIGGLRAGLAALATAAAAALTVVGWLLPFLILGVAVLIPVRWYLRRHRSPEVAAPAPESAAESAAPQQEVSVP